MTPKLENLQSYSDKLILEKRWSPWKGFKEQAAQISGRGRKSKPYSYWLRALKKVGAYPIEYLTPVIKVSHSDELPHAMQRAAQRFDPVIANEIAPIHWGYYFHIGGGLSTMGPEEEVSKKIIKRTGRFRSLHRLRMLGKSLTALYNGDLSQSTCIDLACNWGAFSLEMAALGCKQVTGVDFREENIQKANLLKRCVGLNTVSYAVGDAYEAQGQYDIVLNLGLLYHVTKPFELIQKTYELCTQLAVVETAIHREPFAGFLLGDGQRISHDHAAGVIRTELHPTYRALLDMMRMVGFKNLVEIESEPDPAWADFSSDPFGNKTRRMILGFKTPS
jgi:hypothetical protein